MVAEFIGNLASIWGVFFRVMHHDQCKAVLLFIIKTIVALFLLFLLDDLIAVVLLDFYVRIVPCESIGGDVMRRFDAGVFLTCMLDGNASGCSQWFLSFRRVASGLEKPLLAR